MKTFKRYKLPWRRFHNSDTYADLYDYVTWVNCLCNIRKPLFPSCKKKDMCVWSWVLVCGLATLKQSAHFTFFQESFLERDYVVKFWLPTSPQKPPLHKCASHITSVIVKPKEDGSFFIYLFCWFRPESLYMKSEFVGKSFSLRLQPFSKCKSGILPLTLVSYPRIEPESNLCLHRENK